MSWNTLGVRVVGGGHVSQDSLRDSLGSLIFYELGSVNKELDASLWRYLAVVVVLGSKGFS